MATIEERVDQLERRNHWLVGIGGMLLLAVLIGWKTDSPHAPEIIQAERFQLVDEAGAVRGEFRMNADGPALVLLDDDANERIKLYNSAEATALYILDSEGQPRVGTAHFAHGGDGFALHGPGGVGTSALYMQGSGPGHLAFYDTLGTVIHRFPPSD